MQMMGLRNGARSGAPLPYDAEVEYLQFDGESWIDTQIVAATSVRVDLKAIRGKSAWTPDCIIGTYSGAYSYYQFSFFGSGYSVASGGSYDKSTIGLNPTDEHIVNYNANASHDVIIDGIKYGTTTARSNGQNIFIGRRENSGTAESTVFYVKIFSEYLIPVRDFIMVRVGNIGYMYDRISGQLFGNQGTGAFIIGPDIT